MKTLNDKIDAQWEAKGDHSPQWSEFEGIHPMEEVEALCLGDLCDYTERLARYCKAVQSAYEDGDYRVAGEQLSDKLAEHNSHLGLVAVILAQRTRMET